jgi:hypothetical protein
MEKEDIPTIEEIKKIADTKRKLKNPTKYNLFVKEQMQNLRDENIPNKDKFSTISKKWKEQKEQLPLPEPEPELPQPPKEFKRRIKSNLKSKPETELIPEPKYIPEPELIPEPKYIPEPDNNNKNNDFTILQENIMNIKQLLEEVIKSKPKPKPKPNPALKRVNNTLDLTVNDKEINDIINTKTAQDKKQDEKLKAFLDALTKR